MFNKDSRWIGALVGLLVPFVGFAVLLMCSERLQEALEQSRDFAEPIFDSLTLQILALCLNLVPLHLYNKRRFSQSMYGVLLATMLYAISWIVVFGFQFVD